jgi:hypothetical protein
MRGCVDELLMFFPDACEGGQKFAENCADLLDLWCRIDDPTWLEFLLDRRRPLTFAERRAYVEASHELAERFELNVPGSTLKLGYNAALCAVLRDRIVPDFILSLHEMHRRFLQVRALTGAPV